MKLGETSRSGIFGLRADHTGEMSSGWMGSLNQAVTGDGQTGIDPQDEHMF